MNAQLAFFGKLLLELTLIYIAVVWFVQIARRSIDEVRLQRALSRQRIVPGMFAAAGLGALVPFCSCSTVPLVAAMHRGGVAMPILTTFLVMSPLVNPATLAILAALASPLYAGIYLAGSLFVALVAGFVVGTRRWAPAVGSDLVTDSGPIPSWPERIRAGLTDALTDYRKFFPILTLAAGVAALLHNQVATEWIQATMSQGSWWLVPAAAVIGVPLYASTAVLFPLGSALVEVGVGIGAVSALLMGATGLSVPEGMMLSRLLGGRYVATLAITFTAGVIVVGYTLQALPHFLPSLG